MDIKKESIHLGQGFLHIENINGGVVNINCHDSKHTNMSTQNLKQYRRRHVKNEVSKLASDNKKMLKKLDLLNTKFELFIKDLNVSPVVTNQEDAAQSGLLHFEESRREITGQLVDLSRNRRSREHSYRLNSLHETSRKTQYVANSYRSNCTVIPQKTCDETCNIEHTDRTQSACNLRLFSSESTSCSILKPSESENLPIQDDFNPLDLRSDEESHERVSELKLHEPNICSPDDCTSTKSFLELAETCASQQEQTFSSSYPINDSSSLSARKFSTNLSSPNNGLEENKEERIRSKSHSLRFNEKNLPCLNEACDVETEHNEPKLISREKSLAETSVCELDSHLTNEVCQHECKHSDSCFKEVRKCSEKLISTKEEFEVIKEANNMVEAKDTDNRQIMTSFGPAFNQKEMKSEQTEIFSHVDDTPKIQTKDESFSLHCNTSSEWPDSEMKNASDTDKSLYKKTVTEKNSITQYSVSDGEERQACNESQSSIIPKVSDDQNEIQRETCTLDDRISNRAIPQSVILNAENENGKSTDTKQKSSIPQSDGLPTSQPRTRSLSLPAISYTSYYSLHTKRVGTSSVDSGIDSEYSSSLSQGSKDILLTKTQASLRQEPQSHEGTSKTFWWNLWQDLPIFGLCILVYHCFRSSKSVRIKPVFVTEGSRNCRNVKSIHTNIEEENLAFATVKSTSVVPYESEKGQCQSNTSKDQRNLSSVCGQTDRSNESDIKRLFSSTVCEINKNGQSDIDRENEVEPDVQVHTSADHPGSSVNLKEFQELSHTTTPLYEKEVSCRERYWERHTYENNSKPSKTMKTNKQQIKDKDRKKKLKKVCPKKRRSLCVHPETHFYVGNVSSESSFDSSASWIRFPVKRSYIHPRRKYQTPSFNWEKRTDEKKLLSSEVFLTNRDSGMGSSICALLSCSTNDFLELSSFKTSDNAVDTPFCATEVVSHKSIENSSQFFSRMKPASKTKTADRKKTRDPLKFNLSSSFKSRIMRRRHHKQIRNFFDDIKSQTLKSMVSELHVERTDIQVFGLGSYFDRLNRGEPLSDRDRMQYEWLRLASFQHYTGNGNTLSLARNGFYHDPTDGPTSTRCYLCETRHSTWEYFDNVEAEHRRQSPNCPFHANRNEESTNVSISYEASSQPPKVPPASTPSVNSTIPSSVTQAAPGIASSATGSVTLTVREATRNMAQTQISSQNDEVRVYQPQENDENRQHSLLALPNSRPYRVLGRSGETAYSHLTTPPRRNNIATGAESNAGLDAVANSTATSTTTSTTTSTFRPSSVLGGAIGAGAFGASNPPASSTAPTSSSVTYTSAIPRGISSAKASLLTPSQPPIGGGGRTDPTITVVVNNPKHPDYRDLDARINSFQGWPDYLDQTARQMAEAGFFFVGVADFTRCFCCGGGLRNWEPGDDPMLEHTRWFPRCEYVNKLKGERYVAAVQRRHQEHMAEQQRQQQELAQRRDANRNPPDPMNTEAAAVLREMGYQQERIRDAILAVRQQIGVPDVTTQQVLAWLLDQHEGRSPPTSGRTSPTRDLGVKVNMVVTPSTTQTSTPSTVINTTASVSTATSTVLTGSTSTLTVSSTSTTSGAESQQSGSSTYTTGSTGAGSKPASQTGSSVNEAGEGSSVDKQSAATRGESDEEEFKSAEETPSPDVKSSGKKKSKKKTKTKGGSKSTGASGGPVDAKSLKEENEKLREMQTCKICMERPVNTTLLPCGHLVCCDICAGRLNRCPICRKRIQGTVKTFMS